MHTLQKTSYLAIFGIIALSFTVSDAHAQGKLREAFKERITERIIQSNENTTAPSCTEKDAKVEKIMNSQLGKKRMWGPEADIENLSYGSKETEILDIFYPTSKHSDNHLAPIILMVHGGAWCVGNKDMGSVTEEKTKRWLPKGFLFISIDYPMILDGSNAVDQALSVAKALAYVQKNAKKWNGDPDRIILMGHSAGAHLVSLVNASSQIREKADAALPLGTISLDSAALDVPTQMPVTVAPLKTIYREALGTTKEEWIAASPYYQVDKNSGPWLGVCSTTRPDDPCGQARAYTKKSKTLGVKASVLPVNKGHGEINEDLGTSGKYTETVEEFMGSLDPVISNLLLH